MPELPEVEVVRRGLAAHVVGREIESVHVHHPRAIRRHSAGAADFTAILAGTSIHAAHRRGKYLWMPLQVDGEQTGLAVIAHLGMSGQLLVQPPTTPDETHLRVRVRFADAGPELRFVDQRTFGALSISQIAAGADVPDQISHIARDPLDASFGDVAFSAALRKRRVGLKTALLDQSLISGVGNIYADEALWRARLHWARPTRTLTRPAVTTLLGAIRDVMAEALAAGGTSFDSLYVDVNGSSGYFERGLHAYGREGEPCRRCGTAIRREPFANRSSFSCPRCQRPPRRSSRA